MVAKKLSPSASVRSSGAPTIADVAAAAGVSAMTVSRIINGKKKFREATREAVFKAIDELNYAPNKAARSLAGVGDRRYALLYSNPSAAYLSEFLVGSLDQADRDNVQLIVKHCDLAENEENVIARLINGGVDGVIVPPPLCDSSKAVRAIARSGVPTVLVGTASTPSSLASVSIDDRSAAREMTNHLLDLGHSRIGFITGNKNISATAERLKGYQDALSNRGVSFDPRLVARGLFTYRSGLEAADRLLKLRNAPSAIFASNDDMAAATVAVAHRRGLDVPSDLTVCGFDDSALAIEVWPELTTIRQPIANMARSAIILLTNMLRRGAGTSVESVVLDYVLIKRASDAMAKA